MMNQAEKIMCDLKKIRGLERETNLELNSMYVVLKNVLTVHDRSLNKEETRTVMKTIAKIIVINSDEILKIIG